MTPAETQIAADVQATAPELEALGWMEFDARRQLWGLSDSGAANINEDRRLRLRRENLPDPFFQGGAR